ncbi:NTF2 domain-containing protein [Mycena sanguinolenta]|uniref:NTF2 domain-containing protein n=1 Tax=Mycena sanguinolenta TaxID=230812 RepID=A0A8H6X8P4_9AGAR|nr:NTF2 domain-containing protein [Mycena sanguinolenta]
MPEAGAGDAGFPSLWDTLRIGHLLVIVLIQFLHHLLVQPIQNLDAFLLEFQTRPDSELRTIPLRQSSYGPIRLMMSPCALLLASIRLLPALIFIHKTRRLRNLLFIILRSVLPPPPPANSSRLSATSGSQRYWPVPANCKRAFDPEFDTNRREWLHRECDKLKDLGLKVVKYFFRDDGMVIEWVTRNGEPVWLDSLPDGRQIIDLDGEDPSDNVSALPLPVATPPQSAVAADPEIIDVDASDAVPSPPRLSPPSPIAGPSNPPPDTIPEAQLTEEDLEQLSLDFIEQYVRTFDRNRDALAAAYSEDATISFRYNCSAFPIDSTHSTFQRKGSQSKAGSMPKLPLENYRFSPHRGDFYIDYEVVVIEPEPPVTVLLSAHGEFFGERAQTRMAFDQTFLLRRGGASEAWPLVAISHQIIVRDTPWVRWTGDLSDFTAQHVTLLS